MISFKSDYDFDFQSDKSNKLIPFILSFLMYIVIISIVSGVFTFNLTREWSNSLNGHLTVEIQSEAGAASTITENQKNEILRVIKNTKGIVYARQLQDADVLKILEPWLGNTAIPDDFPFPTIFDVETDHVTKVDLLALNNRLAKISYGVKIHDHADWYAPILKISRGLFGFSMILAFFIFITVCTTVIFITKKTLSVHKDIVRILQLIGARNGYIAAQFKKYYFALSCRASFWSIAISIATIICLNWMMTGKFLTVDSIKYFIFAVLMPVLVTMLVMFTSKNTVLFFLKNDDWID